MKADFSNFRTHLDTALAKILWLYFETPVAGADVEEEVVRERLFCYELYHQLRCACDEASFPYWIGGELDKMKHPIIRSNVKPDLVIHEPGYMTSNLCVIEVKPVSGDAAGFQKDIRTLTNFVTKEAYHAGILLVYGHCDGAEGKIRQKIQTDVSKLRALNIFVLWIENAQAKLIELK